MRRFLSKVPAWLAGAFLVFAGACHMVDEPNKIIPGVRYYPPAVYQQWWDETNRCGGWTDSIDEYVSGGFYVFFREVLHTDEGPALGMLAGNREIWLTEPNLGERLIVEHEMMHAHLIPRGIPGHPTQFFAACGIPARG